jgi:AGCS family alanine or glycine:cation symporter
MAHVLIMSHDTTAYLNKRRKRMDVLATLSLIKNSLDMPVTTLFFIVGIILTCKTKFIQLRALPRFIDLIKKGVVRKEVTNNKGDVKTIDTFHALFTAMSTTIGIGNLVGPTVAIFAGGPGAMFWLLLYIFLGSVTKFTEVVFAMVTRVKTDNGHIIGGPMQYLKHVSHFFANWFMYVMAFLFIGWTMVQSNTLAEMYAHEGVPEWATGLALAAITFYVLMGGAKRVGEFAAKLVPIMFFFYISFAILILLQDITALQNALFKISQCIFSPAAPVGGFVGAGVMQAIKCGLYRGVFITEAGLGTSSIAHAMADTESPVDQGVLAMFSMAADALLALISGLIVLVTGVWEHGVFRSTMIYEAFKVGAPALGQFVLIVSISLFVITTIIGNSFNGRQTFASITNFKYVNWYVWVTVVMTFVGSMLHVEMAWVIMDILISLVAIPNLIGIIILALRRPGVLKI